MLAWLKWNQSIGASNSGCHEALKNSVEGHPFRHGGIIVPSYSHIEYISKGFWMNSKACLTQIIRCLFQFPPFLELLPASCHTSSASLSVPTIPPVFGAIDSGFPEQRRFLCELIEWVQRAGVFDSIHPSRPALRRPNRALCCVFACVALIAVSCKASHMKDSQRINADLGLFPCRAR